MSGIATYLVIFLQFKFQTQSTVKHALISNDTHVYVNTTTTQLSHIIDSVTSYTLI